MDRESFYDASLDVELWRNEESGLVVSVHQYNGAMPKIQIDRRSRFRKLGRVSAVECEKVIPVLFKAIDYIREFEKSAGTKKPITIHDV